MPQIGHFRYCRQEFKVAKMIGNIATVIKLHWLEYSRQVRCQSCVLKELKLVHVSKKGSYCQNQDSSIWCVIIGHLFTSRKRQVTTLQARACWFWFNGITWQKCYNYLDCNFNIDLWMTDVFMFRLCFKSTRRDLSSPEPINAPQVLKDSLGLEASLAAPSWRTVVSP